MNRVVDLPIPNGPGHPLIGYKVVLKYTFVKCMQGQQEKCLIAIEY